MNHYKVLCSCNERIVYQYNVLYACIERTGCINIMCCGHVMRELPVFQFNVLYACNERTVCINIMCCVHVMRGLCVSITSVVCM